MDIFDFENKQTKQENGNSCVLSLKYLWNRVGLKGWKSVVEKRFSPFFGTSSKQPKYKRRPSRCYKIGVKGKRKQKVKTLEIKTCRKNISQKKSEKPVVILPGLIHCTCRKQDKDGWPLLFLSTSLFFGSPSPASFGKQRAWVFVPSMINISHSIYTHCCEMSFSCLRLLVTTIVQTWKQQQQ